VKSREDRLSADTVIRMGGWHPDYARVLVIEQSGDDALVLVDGNGDGAELELEYWRRDADGNWDGTASSGYSALASLPSADTWRAGPFVYALGRSDPTSVVTIEYGGTSHRRQVNEFGIWGFIHEANSRRADELPTVPSRRTSP